MRIDPDKFRKAREATGLNPSQLSKLAGRSRAYAHRLENGTRGTNVSAETLHGFAEVLGVEPGALLVADDPDQVSSATPTDQAPPDGEPDVEPPPTEPEPNPEAWRWG